MDTVNENTNAVVESALSVAPVVEAVPVSAPVEKRSYTSRSYTEELRQRIRGHLTAVCVSPISVGDLSLQMGVDSAVLGYHCRAMAKAGVLKATGEKRGRKYEIILS
jgi:hypothetical protein